MAGAHVHGAPTTGSSKARADNPGLLPSGRPARGLSLAAESLLVVAVDVVQATNDERQLEPMLNKVVALLDT
jgi:hypothetical protein